MHNRFTENKINNMSSGASTTFHSKIEQNGQFPPEAGRYYLFGAHSCPYFHRLTIMIGLKDLGNVIPMIYCNSAFKFTGWELQSDIFPEFKTLKELYASASPGYSGTCSIPVLYDAKTKTIVNNESSQIIKMLNSDFDVLTGNPLDFYPERYRKTIDEFCEIFNKEICVNTYKCGHSKSQVEYEQYFNSVFAYLDLFDKMLTYDYIAGIPLTIGDVIVFTHFIRFDCVFYNLFSLNKKHLWEYSRINEYMKRLCKNKHFAETVNLKEIVSGAYLSENNSPSNLGCIKTPIGFGGINHYF